VSDLFGSASDRRRKPLAHEARPATLDEVVGQTHLVGPGAPLRLDAESGSFGCIILYGPSGTGKTTLALALGAAAGKEFRVLHPAEHGVPDIKKVAEEARFHDILLFIDEIHRFSSAQQDYLLKLTEEGTVDLIGATTGNPYFVLTKALVSRATIYKLEPHSPAEVERVVARAFAALAARGLDVSATPTALRMMGARASGDARRAVNVVERMAKAARPGTPLVIDDAMVEVAYAASPVPYDRSGDDHYDVVSAFVKSMRGSDPDATLYWLARLVHAGEDPRYIARRILVHASEDVGLADPTAIQVAVAALAAVEHVGYPEARITLAHAALHVARAPKSNSAYRGIALALAEVERGPLVPVPPNMRDAHYAGAAKLGNAGYAFPHDDPRGWVRQPHAPGVRPGQFYQSDARGGATFEDRADAHWERVTGRPQPRTWDKG